MQMKNILSRFSLKKKVFIAVIVLIASVAGFNYYQNVTKPPAYKTAAVARGDLTEIVSESGTVATNARSDVYSPTNGIITNLFVSNGDTVRKGDTLFVVESTATQEEKATAYAAYQSAVSTLQQAENTLRDKTAIVNEVLDRVKNHSKDESFAQKEERTTAEVAKDNAFDSVKIARAQLTQKSLAFKSTQDATVTAPISGNIYNLSVATGSGVLTNSVLAPVTPVLKISSAPVTEVVLSLNENDINKVKEGQGADINVDAIDNKIYKGVIKRLDTFGTNVAGVIKYNVYIEVLDFDNALRPGMTVDADIVTKKITNALTVPNSAVKPFQGGKGVRVPVNKTETKLIPVKVGVRGSDKTEILEGLAEGQVIVSSLASEQVSKKGPFGF